MENKVEKRKKAAVSTTIAIAAVIIVIAVAGVLIYYFSMSSQPQVTTIKIGLVAPYGLAEGQDMDRGAKLAVSEINLAGGIFVRELNRNVTIELVIIDTEKADPDVGTTGVTRAVTQDKVDVLIGGYSSRETMATEVVAIQNNIPFIVSGASSKSVTTRTDYNTSYIFHYCTTTDHQAKAIVNFYNDVMKPLVSPDRNFTLAVLYRDDAFGKGVLDSCKKLITNGNFNITIISEEKFTPGATDYKTQLGKIKAANPDALLAAGFNAETTEIFIQGQQDVALNTSYMAIENNDAPEFYTGIKRWGESQLLQSKYGTYAGPPFYLSTIDSYSSNFKAKYGMVPGNMGADTYDAFYIMKNAVERAGSLNKTLIRDALETTNMTQGLLVTESGRIEFSANPATYHEILGVTFIQQLIWNATLGECRPLIVYPTTQISNIGFINQTTFVLPEGYQPRGP